MIFGRTARPSLIALPMIVVLCVTSACGGAPGAAARASGLVLVGSALSLTGDLAGEGRLTEEGYQYCEDVINAHGGVRVGGRRLPLSISYADDQSSPTESARIVRQFGEQGINLILGPYGSSATAAVAAVGQSNKQVVVDSGGADNGIFSHGYTQIVGVESPASNYAASIIDAIAENVRPLPRLVAVVSADDNFSQEVARYAVEEAQAQGMSVLPLVTFPAGSTDLSSVVTRLRAEHPDLVIESGHFVEGVALVRQAAQLGLRPAAIGETVAPTDPAFVKSLGNLAEHVIGSTQWVPNQAGRGQYFGTATDYARGFRAMFGFTPDYHAAEASAACLALVLAIEHAGSTDPERVIAALRRLDIDSFFGRIHFAPDGQDITRPMNVVQIQHGRPVTVWPRNLAQAPLSWPRRPPP